MKAVIFLAVLCIGATVAQARLDESLTFFGRSLQQSSSGCKVRSNGRDRSEGCGEVCSTSGGLCAAGSAMAQAYRSMGMDCVETCQSCCSNPNSNSPRCGPYRDTAPETVTPAFAFGDLWTRNCRGECGITGSGSPSPARGRCFSDCQACGAAVKSDVKNYCNILERNDACKGLDSDIKDDVQEVVYQICSKAANKDACGLADKRKKKKKMM